MPTTALAPTNRIRSGIRGRTRPMRRSRAITPPFRSPSRSRCSRSTSQPERSSSWWRRSSALDACSIGAHYPSDIGAGIVVGLLAAGVVVRSDRASSSGSCRMSSGSTDPVLRSLWPAHGGVAQAKRSLAFGAGRAIASPAPASARRARAASASSRRPRRAGSSAPRCRGRARPAPGRSRALARDAYASSISPQCGSVGSRPVAARSFASSHSNQPTAVVGVVRARVDDLVGAVVRGAVRVRAGSAGTPTGGRPCPAGRARRAAGRRPA